jgi:hypothetical protein
MDGWVVAITGTTNTVAARLMKVATKVLPTYGNEQCLRKRVMADLPTKRELLSSDHRRECLIDYKPDRSEADDGSKGAAQEHVGKPVIVVVGHRNNPQ